MLDVISIDLGYSSSKICYSEKIAKFPTAISFATDVGIAYGEENVYSFEGEKYYVGKEAATSEAFTTNDYKFLHKFAPLLIYHILSKFDEVNLNKPIIVKTGLAIVDWPKKQDFIDRISTIEVDDKVIKIQPELIPQGAGCAMDWTYYNNNSEYPDKLSVIDIGYNTVNVLGFNNGKPVRSEMKSYPGHGVSSIIKPFTAFMENKFKVTFSEQEAIGIFVKGEFKYNGELQEEVSDKIIELKKQFVTKLFQSILINDKKQLAMADVALIAGGGAYLLQDIAFPENVKFVDAPYEFSNARGFLV